MSKLVDMCTNEFAKLRQKGRDAAAAPGEPSPPSPRAEPDVAAPAAYPGLSQALRIKPREPATLFSDAALAMIVECFSP